MTKHIPSSLSIKTFAHLEEKKGEGGKLQTEYHAAKKAEYAKTAKLRELRLAKEAADRAAKQPAGSAPQRKSVKRLSSANACPPKARRSISWGL
jgi:hypothetical protein